jgi:hypothetical protein
VTGASGHKRVLKRIRWIRPLPPDHKFAPADAPVHFNPGKFRRIPGQLALAPEQEAATMYRCTACEREFTSSAALATHVCETHSDEQEGR